MKRQAESEASRRGNAMRACGHCGRQFQPLRAGMNLCGSCMARLMARAWGRA
jgi:hypothetical protein